jgi:hypothetical protein
MTISVCAHDKILVKRARKTTNMVNNHTEYYGRSIVAASSGRKERNSLLKLTRDQI